MNKASIWFIYDDAPAIHRETTVDEAEKDIRYWLGKSPGIHDLNTILVVDHPVKNWIFVHHNMLKEAAQYLADQEEQRERELLKRLQEKYGNK